MSRIAGLSLLVLSLGYLGNALAEEQPLGRPALTTLLSLGHDVLSHGGPVRALAYSPDGRCLFSAAEGIVSRWDLGTGQEQVRFTGSPGRIRTLALSPDGKTLLTGGSDVNVRIYDAQTPADEGRMVEVSPRATLAPKSALVESLAFHPSGRSFAVGLEDGQWLRYDTETRRELECREIGEPIGVLAFLPDGKHLLTPRNEGGLICWRIPNPARVQEMEGETPASLAISPGATHLAIGDFGGDLSFIRLADGVTLWKKRVPGGMPRRRDVAAVVFTPDGAGVLTAGQDGYLRRWDVARGEETARQDSQGGAILALAVSPDGKELASAGETGIVQRWTLATLQPLGGTLASRNVVRSLAMAVDGKGLMLVRGSTLELRQGQRFEAAPLPKALAVQSTVHSVYPGLQSDDYLLLSRTGKLLRHGRELNLGAGRIQHVARQGDLVAVLTSERHVVLLDLARPEAEPLRLSLVGDIGTSVAISPDGKHVAATASSALVRLWEVKTGRLLHELPGSLGGGLTLTFSPDSRLLYHGGRDRMVRAVEVTSGDLRQELAIGPGYPTSLALTCDGRHLAIGSHLGSVGLYDSLRGVLLDQFPGHRGAVAQLAFRGTSSELVSLGSEGSLLVREVGPMLRANRPQPLTLTRPQLEEAWSHLGFQDPRSVALAIQTLVRAEQQSLAWIQAELRPVESDRVQQRLHDLEADDFETRDRGFRELGRMGKAIENTLKAHRERPGASLDFRLHVEELLDRIAQNRATPDYLQSLRAIEVLERIGTATARTHLEKMATGLADAEVTRQAQAALLRLKERP